MKNSIPQSFCLGQSETVVIPIRGWCEWVHLLVTGPELVLIDTGLFGEHRPILRVLNSLGSETRLQTLLLTHGHLDHSGNLATLQQQIPSLDVRMHPDDAQHLNQSHPYRGIARVCGALEAAGRTLTAWKAPSHWTPLEDGQTLPVAGGLRVVHLP